MTALTVRPATAADPDGDTTISTDAPEPEAISTALLLSEILQHLSASRSHLHELVAAATGLRLGELRVLEAVAADTAELAEMPAGVAEPLLTFARRARAELAAGAGSR